jgi:hypothetical protein
MLIAGIILGILLLLLVLVCLLRVGVQLAFDTQLAVWLRIGPFRVQLYPPKEESGQAEKKKPAEEKPQKPKPEGKKSWKDHFSSFSFADLRMCVGELWPPLRRTLSRLRRGIRIDPLRLSITVGGLDDPASAAQMYGWLGGVIWGGMPVLEQLLVIPEPSIHLGMDFAQPKTAVEGEVGVTLRVGTLVRLGLGMAGPAMRCIQKLQHQKTDETGQANKSSADTAA